MMEALAKLGATGAVGFLIGLALVWWVEPTTNGGVALLIVAGIAIGIIAGAIWSFFSKKKPA